MGGQPTAENPFLTLRDIRKNFGAFTALESVSLDVKSGELVCILGPSGCGKTTLLRIIAGLEEQNQGRITMSGKDISRQPTNKRDFGIVFQSYALFPNLTAAENVAYGLGRLRLRKQKYKDRAQEMLDLVGLKDIGHKYPAQLSGGQQQRVALARALAPSPSMLLLDEPLSALDAQVRIRLRKEIRDLQKRLGVTTIMVTHDQEEALTMADRIVVLEQGKLVQYATPSEIYHKPTDPFVAEFIGSMNFLSPWRVTEKSSLKHGDLTMNITHRIMDGEKGKDLTIGIRPEDIQVLDYVSGEDNVFKAHVDDLEFRGAFYRLGMTLLEGGDGTPMKIEADIQADILKRQAIEAGHEVLVQLPSERLLFFDPSNMGEIIN